MFLLDIRRTFRQLKIYASTKITRRKTSYDYKIQLEMQTITIFNGKSLILPRKMSCSRIRKEKVKIRAGLTKNKSSRRLSHHDAASLRDLGVSPWKGENLGDRRGNGDGDGDGERGCLGSERTGFHRDENPRSLPLRSFLSLFLSSPLSWVWLGLERRMRKKRAR